jgi:hypothetical protein
MTARLLAAVLLTASLSLPIRAADEEPAKKPARNEALRAQITEDAKKQAAATPAPTTPPAAAASAKTPTPAKTGTGPEKEKPKDAGAAPAKSAEQAPPPEPATVLPKMEVNRSKLHPLARELYEKEREVAREKQLTKPTELDKALNNPKLSLPIFGGQSTSSRASIASERTALLEAEADLIEEIGRARTKEQKEELRKQLDELKKVRRDLEHAIR